MTARRLKGVILVSCIVVSGLTLIAWTQTWFVVSLVPDELGGASVAIAGDIAAGGLAALGLAGLALVGALSIAGPFFRVILGALESLIGATVTLSAVLAVTAPVAASAAAITEATGVSGDKSVAELVKTTSFSLWPWLAVVLGVAGMTLGILIIVTGRRWPGSSRKYQAVRFDPADNASTAIPAAGISAAGAEADAPPVESAPLDAVPADAAPDAASLRADAVADWDALSDGSDPTSR